MNDNSQPDETLMQYLDGDLQGDALQSFKKLLAENTTMQKELENLILAREAIKSYGLKTQVAHVHQEMMEEFAENKETLVKTNIRFFGRRLLNIAASLLIVMFSFGVYQYLTISGRQVFNDSYQAYDQSISRGDDTGESAIEKAYAKGDHDVVISEFEKMNDPDAKHLFLAGQVFLSKNGKNEAIQCFQRVLKIKTSKNAFKDDAEYYLGLAYLKNNEPGKAVPIFQKINQDENHLYHDRVTNWTLLKMKVAAFKSSVKR